MHKSVNIFIRAWLYWWEVLISIDTSGTVINKYQYFPLHKNSKNIEKLWRFRNNFRNILKDTGKTKKIVGDFSTNFGSTAENIIEILRKCLNDFVELLRILTLGNNVSWKLQENPTLILQKLWMNIWVTLNIINFAEIMKKFWKHFLIF